MKIIIFNIIDSAIRPPYSDTESSSGYMTSRSNYDMRSPYSSAKTSSSRSSLINGNGPYLNVPFPPKHQRQDSNATSTFAPSPQGPQPPPSLLDLSSNREHRGSAFELYRKPGDSMTRSSGFHHSLPPPPPVLMNIDHK